MSSDVVIEVSGLNKAYQIFDKPQDRFKQMIARGRKQYYSEFQALQDTSFTVRRGETVGIVGKNGSGKSTLLQIICGTLSQTSGDLKVSGKIAALLELGAGFDPEFTGLENINLYASILGLSNEEIAERLPNIVDFADIGEFLYQPVKTYSSGMVVRLAFAVIAHVDADILVIDEALAVGDVYFVQKCMRFLRSFREKGTLLFVSHDMGSVLALCDRAILLEQGEVKAIDVAKKVVGQYLEGLYSDDSNEELVEAVLKPVTENDAPVEYKDQRTDFINSSNLRNDIEVLAFDSDAENFTEGQADIVNVEFTQEGKRLTWIVGGESVCMKIQCISAIALERPIVGFLVKNRLGQNVFGDNTYIAYLDSPVRIPAGNTCTASFDFTMPLLPVGEYTVDVSISEGDQDNHRMLNWKYDVIVFTVQTSSVVHGLVGVPMKSIHLDPGASE
ncbi:MAG: lipopolysaccharide transport system ATP-binding protein [Halioglobus sp.]|jgi:lipopolysaccharide transport system ATP-binding protein